MANAETNLQGRIMVALSQAGCLVWRQNTGALPDPRTGRLVRYGLCKGSSDIVGVCPDGIALFVEVKTKSGKVSIPQEMFLSACLRHGARAGVARSVEDALAIAAPA